MGRGYRRSMWRVVPCTSRRILRTESSKDIQEILSTKLPTIKEEPEPPEISEEKRTPVTVRLQLQVAKSVKKKISSNYKAIMKKRSFKDSYAFFMAAGFAS